MAEQAVLCTITVVVLTGLSIGCPFVIEVAARVVTRILAIARRVR